MISQNNQRIAELSSENIGILSADLFPDTSGTLTDEQIQEIKEIADKDVVLFLQSDNEYVYTPTFKIKTNDYSVFEFIQQIPENSQGSTLTLIEISTSYIDKTYHIAASEYRIITNGDGTKFLSDDGSYREIDKNTVANINTTDAITFTIDENNFNIIKNSVENNNDIILRLNYNLSGNSFNESLKIIGYKTNFSETYEGISLIYQTITETGKHDHLDAYPSFTNSIYVYKDLTNNTYKVALNAARYILSDRQFAYIEIEDTGGTFDDFTSMFVANYSENSGWLNEGEISNSTKLGLRISVGAVTSYIETEEVIRTENNFSPRMKILYTKTRKINCVFDDDSKLYNYTVEKLTEISSDDVLTKTNTTSYTPTQLYHPATKYYVDDFMHCSGGLNNDTTDPITTTFGYKTGNHDDIANHGSLDCFIYAVGNISIPYYINTNTNEGYTYATVMHDSYGNLLEISKTNFVIDAKAKTASITLVPKYIQRILTESEYQALGDSVNSDGVLYFITED